MGTTLTALQSGRGPKLATVMLVEGYPKIITDWKPLSAVVTAYADSDWNEAIGGLNIHTPIRQRFRPWSSAVDVGSLTVEVLDATDDFGTKVFGTGAGEETYLTADISATATTIPVLSTAAFDPSGIIHIGTEKILFDGTTATSFTDCVRGLHAPLKANTVSDTRFARTWTLPNADDGQGSSIPIRVTSAPRTWRGRQVTIMVHRVVDGVLDVYAQAERIFIGRIVTTRDTSNGAVVLELEDARAYIRDKTILAQQWNARVREGVRLVAGMTFSATDQKAGNVLDANDLVVVAASPGANEILEGWYTIDQLGDALNDWLADELGAARLNLTWTIYPRAFPSNANGEMRCRIRWSNGSTTSTNDGFLTFPSAKVSTFLGFAGQLQVGENWQDDAVKTFDSPERPLRIAMTGSVAELEDIRGEWINNSSLYGWPSAFGVAPDAGLHTDSMAVLRLGTSGPMAVFEAVDDADDPTQINLLAIPSVLGRAGAAPWTDADSYLRVYADDDREIRFYQVIWLRAPANGLLNRIFASSGTSGYNHATFDAYPQQLGAAIPWDALGSTWTQSLAALGIDALTMMIDKPTRLTDLIGCEFVARAAMIVMKSGRLRVASWGTPIASLASFTLAESDKGAPLDAKDDQRCVRDDDDEFMCNFVKVSFNRDVSGNYRDHVIVDNPGARSETGVDEPKTISMRNTWGAFGDSSSDIAEIQAIQIGLLEMFSRPLHRLRRTINLTKYAALAPGDFGTLSDDHARNPADGTRGISSRPCLLVEHGVDWGSLNPDDKRPMMGEVTLTILPLDNISSYSPCAQIDHDAANGGYDSGTSTLTCEAHQHSESSEAADASHFPNGSTIRIIQIDPDTAASPLSWDRDVTGQSGNTITFSGGALGGWDANLWYRVVPRQYDDASAAHQANVFQADADDGLINDERSAYVYGHAPQQSEGGWTANDPSVEPAQLYSTLAFADGYALDTGYEQDIARLANNLVRYRTAVNFPQLYRTVIAAGTTGFIKRVIERRQIYVGPGELGTGERLLHLRPMFRRATAGADVTLWATLCRHPPIGSQFDIDDADAPEYVLVGPISETLSWTTGSATWAHGTSEELSVRIAHPLDGTFWLIVEAEPNIEYRGMSRAQLGPFTEDDDV